MQLLHFSINKIMMTNKRNNKINVNLFFHNKYETNKNKQITSKTLSLNN